MGLIKLFLQEFSGDVKGQPNSVFSEIELEILLVHSQGVNAEDHRFAVAPAYSIRGFGVG